MVIAFRVRSSAMESGRSFLFGIEAPSTSTGITRSQGRRPSESLRLQPVIKLVHTVIAAGALGAHAEPVAAGAEDVRLGPIARRPERVVKPHHRLAGYAVVLRPGHEDRRQSRRDRGHY